MQPHGYCMNPLKPPERDDYIFAQRNRRERTAINRLIATHGGVLNEALNEQLRWSLPWAWLGLRIPQRRLLKGCELPTNKFLGDVDVFGGPLRPASQEEYNRFVAEAAERLGAEAHLGWHHQIASMMFLERHRLMVAARPCLYRGVRSQGRLLRRRR